MSSLCEDHLTRTRMTGDIETHKKGADADAVIGVDLDYEVLGRAGSMLMVNASGGGPP